MGISLLSFSKTGAKVAVVEVLRVPLANGPKVGEGVATHAHPEETLWVGGQHPCKDRFVDHAFRAVATSVCAPVEKHQKILVR